MLLSDSNATATTSQGSTASRTVFEFEVTPKPQPLTFEKLCELEPRLLDLYNEAKAIKDNRREPSFCANRIWKGYDRQDGGLSSKLFRLVGCGARKDADPRLHTSRAWAVAHHMIYGALPDCRNCVCCAFQAIVDERLGR